jgi:hypothetical protein
MNRHVLMLMLTFAAVPPCAAGTIAQTRGDAELKVQFDGQDAKIALADLIDVTLTVEGGPDLIVKAPLELPTSAPWTLIERSEPTRRPIGAGRIRWRLTYRFAPRQPGKLAFAFPDVKFRAGTGAEQSVGWDPIPFTVTTQEGELRADTGVEELPPVVPPDRSWQIWSGVAGLGLFLIALLFVLRSLFRLGTPRTPAQHALHEWDRLVALKLPEQGRSERFITLLTTLLRRYLERQYAMPARRRTTPEILGSLAEMALSAEEKRFLAQFLERCEAVKFAGVPMPADECNQWAQATKQFLQRRKLNHGNTGSTGRGSD